MHHFWNAVRTPWAMSGADIKGYSGASQLFFPLRNFARFGCRRLALDSL
jgi:hypothetical protein